MQIKLRQAEIIAALSLYLGTKGVNTDGMYVNAEFTQSRKDGGGLVADVEISDHEPVPSDKLPKVGDGPHAAAQADLKNADANAKTAAVADAAEATPQGVAAAAEAKTEGVPAADAETPAAAPTGSLFGG